MKRALHQRTWAFLLDPIVQYQNTGFPFTRKDDRTFWIVPRVFFICNDSPESDITYLTYGAWNSLFPCHICMTPGGRAMWNQMRDPNNYRMVCYTRRTVTGSQTAIQNRQAATVSIHPESVSIIPVTAIVCQFP